MCLTLVILSLSSAVTGIELNDSIDMSAAVYGDTDKLLCHDDELEGVCFEGECMSDREMWQNSVQGGILMRMEIPCFIVCRWTEFFSLYFFALMRIV